MKYNSKWRRHIQILLVSSKHPQAQMSKRRIGERRQTTKQNIFSPTRQVPSYNNVKGQLSSEKSICIKKWKLLNQLPVNGYLACELFSCIFTSNWGQKSLTLSLIFCRENYNFCILKAIISCIDYLNSIQYIRSDRSTLKLKTYVTIFSKILKSSTPCSNRTFIFLANSIKMNMKLL